MASQWPGPTVAAAAARTRAASSATSAWTWRRTQSSRSAATSSAGPASTSGSTSTRTPSSAPSARPSLRRRSSSRSTAAGTPPPRPGRWSVAGVEIPSRPTGQRPSTAPLPEHNHYPHQNPWFVGAGGAPVAGGRWGNYTFSAAIGGLFPLPSFQVHGFPQATAYGPTLGFHYGYGHSFHGWHGHGFPREVPH